MQCWIGAACGFERCDRLVDARLQQMHFANTVINNGDLGISGAKTNGVLHERDYFLYGARHQLAVAESEQRPYGVAIEREHGLVFGNGLVISALRAQHLAAGEMYNRTAR